MKGKFGVIALLLSSLTFAAPVSTPSTLNDTPIISGGSGTCGRIDLTYATSDYMLKPCEEAVINFTNPTYIPLRIAVDRGAVYQLISNAGGCVLYPNNTSYPNLFFSTDWGINGSDREVFHYFYLARGDAFLLGNASGAGLIISYIDTSISKTITQHAADFSFVPPAAGYSPYSIRHFASHWISPTSWTSLGTLRCYPLARPGYVLIKRIK
jgi:hypothetical protein